MVQVTMNGLEYKDLLKAEQERDDLINVLCRAQQVSFDDTTAGSYFAGKFPEQMQYPTWLQEKLLKAMEAQLLLKKGEELDKWFESGCYFYSVVERSFCQYKHEGMVNMIDYSVKLKSLHNKFLKKKEAEEERTDDEAGS